MDVRYKYCEDLDRSHKGVMEVGGPERVCSSEGAVYLNELQIESVVSQLSFITSSLYMTYLFVNLHKHCQGSGAGWSTESCR